jgi:isopenicillin-N N-acyltransferase-like protein
MYVMLDLPTIELSGSPARMGEALGEGCRDTICALVDRRTAAAQGYVSERGLEDVDLVGLGDDCLQVLRCWDPAGYEEHVGVATGAGLDAATLYAMLNLTDIRDLATVPAQVDAEGCTAVMVPPEASASGTPIAGQTWDLVAGDVDSIVAVHRTPTNGPRTWSVTVAGGPTLMGLNEEGLALGTTNIKVAGARVGVGYMSLLHKAIHCGDRREASECVVQAPRVAAHTYWFADTTGVLELECDAMACTLREGYERALVRTNHCLEDDRVNAEAPAESSTTRLARAQTWANRDAVSIEDIRRLFEDRSDGVCSINRRHDDGEPTATNACVIADPVNRVLHACRGEADRGTWVALTF